MRRLILILVLLLPSAAAAQPVDRFEQGERFFKQGNFLASALAFVAFADENPEHERAVDALFFAVSAAKRAIAQHGEDPDDPSTPFVRMWQSIRSRITYGPCGPR